MLSRFAISHLFLWISMVITAPVGAIAAVDNEKIASSPELIRLFTAAAKSNPGLAAIEHQVAALEKEAVAAGVWDDPRIGFGLLNLPTDTFRLDQEAMTQKQITVSQRLPWFGKLDFKTQQAALKAIQKKKTLQAQRLKLFRRIAGRYYELGFVTDSLKINTKMLRLLDQIIQVANTRYATGKGLQQDVLQAQVEQSRLIEEHNSLEKKVAVIQARLQELVGQPGMAPVTPPSIEVLPNFELRTAQWRETVTARHPELQVRQVAVDLSRVAVDLARKAYWPDPDLRLAYGQRDADPSGRERADFASASVMFSIPLWKDKKQDSRLDAAKKRYDAAMARYRELAQELPHRVSSAAIEAETLAKNHALYSGGLMVQAEQWSRAAISAYGVGKVDFATMISAQLRLLQIERQSKDHLYRWHKTVAVLNEMMGGSLTTTAVDKDGTAKPVSDSTDKESIN